MNKGQIKQTLLNKKDNSLITVIYKIEDFEEEQELLIEKKNNKYIFNNGFIQVINTLDNTISFLLDLDK